MFKSTVRSVMLYNAFAIGAMTYLAVIFGKWWIVLFSLLFLVRCAVVDKDDGGEEDV